MKHATLPRRYLASPNPIPDREIFPFGTFCRRGNYCPQCTYDCRQKIHIRETREMWDKTLKDEGSHIL